MPLMRMSIIDANSQYKQITYNTKNTVKGLEN